MVSRAPSTLLGLVVTSRAGRDRGDRYVVIGTLGEDLVLVADGEKRGVDRPKKKNVKHLILHEAVPALSTKLAQGETVRDEEIRQALAEGAGAAGAGPAAAAAETEG